MPNLHLAVGLDVGKGVEDMGEILSREVLGPVLPGIDGPFDGCQYSKLVSFWGSLADSPVDIVRDSTVAMLARLARRHAAAHVVFVGGVSGQKAISGREGRERQYDQYQVDGMIAGGFVERSLRICLNDVGQWRLISLGRIDDIKLGRKLPTYKSEGKAEAGGRKAGPCP